MIDIDDSKRDLRRGRWVKFRLRSVVVYESPGGYYFTDRLDHVEEIAPEVDERALSELQARYLRDTLAANRERVAAQLAWVQRALDPSAMVAMRALDVGCGTGAFLSELRALGASVEGIELTDDRVLYARRVHGLSVNKHPLGSEHWQRQLGSFDLVTLFDVLEHVDRPLQTLRDACALLKPGGLLALDTPGRDGAFHRMGELGYALSAGRFPTLLDLMYAGHRFAHKQILSSKQVGELLDAAGLSVQRLELVHDLALPHATYLRNLLEAPRAAAALAPAARALFSLLPLRNKIRALARKW